MKKLFSLILALLMLAGAAVAVVAGDGSPFSDVKTTRWSYGAIINAVNKGYMNGVSDGKFDPAGSMTRGMVVTVLYRREGSPAVTFRDDFTDVKAGKYYSDAVIWAKDEGIVNGITETTFEPNGKITREQLATMLSRFSERCPVSVPERADLSGYPDNDKIHSYARDAMAWANEANLIKGMSDGTLSPRGYATREQFATILQRFDETFTLAYNEPVLRNQYTEKPYPLVENADLYVAVDGDDSGPGTFDAPLATFAGAVAKVREIKSTKSGDIIVAFKAGEYGAVELELTAEDGGSPDQQIVYCAYGDGEVTFNNGVTIAEDEFLPLDESEKRLFNSQYSDNIKKADLVSRIGTVPEYKDFAIFNDNEVCHVARFPNRYADGTDNFLKALETYDNTRFHVTLPLLAGRLARYSEEIIRGMRIYGYLYAGYRKDILEISAFDAENDLITTTEESRNMVWGNLRANWRDADGEGIRMFVLNVSYELDNRGEYWVDRDTGTLYVYAPSGDYRIPMAHGEKRIRGVARYDTGDGYPAKEGYCSIYAESTGYITLRGLHFTNNVDEFIMGYKTSGFEIDRCKFDSCTGWQQLLFEYSLPDTPMGLKVTDCTFDMCIGRHVYVFDEAGGPERFTNRSEILIDNCLFAHANLSFDAEGAVNLHQCSGGEVSHNRFENCYRYAVMFTGSCDVIVEYNDFDSAMTNSDDGGVTRGCSDVLGNCVVRYNFYNAISPGSVGHFAHYCDNGDCGTVMYSNLFFDAGIVCYHGAGRDNVLSDNVMIGTNAGTAVGSMTEDIIENGLEGTGPWGLKGQWDVILGYIETVPGYAEALEARRPGATHLLFDSADARDKAYFLAPTNTITGNLFINDDAADKVVLVNNSGDYCTVEGNVAVTYAENPVFVNPTIGDYRIRDGVDFPDIHFEEIGRY